MIPPNPARHATPDRRDIEIERLERQLARAREREKKIREEERRRFSVLTSASRRFAASMRSRLDERQRQQRRLDAQYAVSRILEESRDLHEAGPEIFHALGLRLGWRVGVLWTVEERSLRCTGLYRADGAASGGFEELCLASRFPRGSGLPGRVWWREEPCWVDDVLGDDDYPHRDAAAAEGLRCALAFPIQDGGRLVGVFELLKEESSPADDDVLRTVHLVGRQMGQFVERRWAEAERDRALFREREAKRDAIGVLESINDAFFAVDRDWRFTYVNRRAEEFWNRRRGDLLGKGMWEEFPEAVGSDAARGLHRAMERRETVGFETVSPVRRGLWISIRAYPSADGISVYFTDITESKKVQEALRESEERYRSLTANVPGAVFRATVTDGRPVMEFVNEWIEEITGYPAGGFLADKERNYVEVIHPEDAPNNERQVWRALEQRETYDIEYRVLHADGGTRWVNERGTGVFSEGGRLLWVDGAIFDVTERRRTEEALRASEEKYRSLFESIDEGFCTIEMIFEDEKPVDYRFLEVNAVFERQTGLVDAAGRRMRELAPLHEEHWFEIYGKVAVTGESVRFEERAERLGRWFDVYASRVGGEESRRVAIVFNDITDRKRTEEALREYDEWLRIAQRAARSGTWEWDFSTGEIRWSDEHRALFGFDARSPVTREGWWAAVHPEDLPRIEEAGRRCTEEGEEWPEIEYRILRDGQTRWIDARGRIVRDERDRPVRILGISVDVTERKEIEAERDRLLVLEWVASAEAAERERISRELHDRVAHSMGVAHQSLQLYEVLRSRDPGRAAERLVLAREMTKAALESTRNLSAELRHLEAEEGLQAELQNLLDVAVPPRVRAEFAVEGDEGLVPGHVRGQIFLILREAVRNAVAHSGCSALDVGLRIERDRVIGSVEDDGRGFVADGANGGVGLRSMKERTGLLDGSLRFEGGPGLGTRVEVEVPLGGER